MRNLEKPAALKLALCLLHDYFVSDCEVSKDAHTLTRRVCHEGLPFLTKVLPKLGKSFDAALGTGIFTWDHTSFKPSKISKAVPEFLRSLFLRVFDLDGNLLTEDHLDYEAVRVIRTICFLFYKLELDVEYDEESIMIAFENNDDDVITTPMLANRALHGRIKECFTSVFADFNAKRLVPRHGPGVSSNLPSKNAKFSYYPPNSAVVSKFGRRFFNHPVEIAVVNTVQFLTAMFGGCKVEPYLPVAKMLLVPKDSRGPRVISCEPTEHMYAQQSIKDYMVRTLESHPRTLGRINFTDQTVNRNLVVAHSVDKEYSTLDLKDASDMVPNSIIMDVLPPEMAAYVASCRTEYTESPKGDRVRKLNKFAPMGSALCFPMMASYLYFGITSYISMVKHVPTSLLRSVYVYGDDIVVPTEYAPLAIRAIELMGLKVNEGKSFVDSRFLESCGMDCIDGREVTPFRIRNLNDKNQRTSPRKIDKPDALVHWVALANNCQAVYPTLSEELYRMVESHVGRLPYGVATAPFLCRISATSEDAWRENRRFGLKPAKIQGWSQKTIEVEFPDSYYGQLRRSLTQIGTEHPFEHNTYPGKSTYLRKKKYKEWYSTSYA